MRSHHSCHNSRVIVCSVVFHTLTKCHCQPLWSFQLFSIFIPRFWHNLNAHIRAEACNFWVSFSIRSSKKKRRKSNIRHDSVDFTSLQLAHGEPLISFTLCDLCGMFCCWVFLLLSELRKKFNFYCSAPTRSNDDLETFFVSVFRLYFDWHENSPLGGFSSRVEIGFSRVLYKNKNLISAKQSVVLLWTLKTWTLLSTTKKS